MPWICPKMQGSTHYKKRMNGAKFFAGISETVGVQQGRDGRSVLIFISSTFFSFSRFFHLYFSLTSWLIFCYRNVLEDSFLTNTIPEFDPTPPRVRLSIVLEIKHNLMRWRLNNTSLSYFVHLIKTFRQNVSALVGKTAFLTCVVRNLKPTQRVCVNRHRYRHRHFLDIKQNLKNWKLEMESENETWGWSIE